MKESDFFKIKNEMRPPEEIENENKLINLERQLSEYLNAQDVPTTGDCRINPEAFEKIYGTEQIKRDEKYVKELEQKWAAEEGDKTTRYGEQFEALKTIIFHKFLGKDFIVLRSSLYDDIVNKVDNIILDKKTGNLVCALDEVATMTGERFENKKSAILERNKGNNGGGRLKYGLFIKEGKLSLGSTKHFPIFYLAIKPNYLKEAIRKMQPSLNETTEYERKLFDYFISLIDYQIKEMQLNPSIRENIKRSIIDLGHYLEAAKEKIENKYN